MLRRERADFVAKLARSQLAARSTGVKGSDSETSGSSAGNRVLATLDERLCLEGGPFEPSTS